MACQLLALQSHGFVNPNARFMLENSRKEKAGWNKLKADS